MTRPPLRFLPRSLALRLVLLFSALALLVLTIHAAVGLHDRTELLFALASVAVTAAVFAWAAHRALGPLARVSKFAGELHLRNGARLDLPRMPTELRALADALNFSADRLSRQAEVAQEDGARIRAVLESALDCIVSVDNGGHITEFNPAAERTFGYRRDEVIGRDMSTMLLPLPLMSQHIEAMLPYQEGRADTILGHRRAVKARRRNGSEFPAEVAVIASNISGRREFTVWLRDITETRQAADAMLKARIAAEDSNRAKSDFLANMSHEIRTPLNAIIGITELALDTELSREQRDYLNLVRSSGDALLSIINELLDYSKIEAGHLEFEQIEFSLRQAVATAVRALAPKAHEQRLELLIQIHRDVPDTLIGDPHRIRQILTNLVGNAVKFTSQGEIEVQVSRLPVQEDDNVMLQFSVRDTGIGIPRDKLDVIFDAFTQVDTSTTRRFGGTGLGLAICTRLVEAMGGRIWAESEPGRGSLFRFSARLGVGASAHAPTPPTDLAGVRILVADSNRRHRALLGDQLSDWGARARGVETVASLLAELDLAAKSGLPYRIALVDAGLLDIDGSDIVERIRSTLPPPALIVMQAVHMRRRSTDVELPGIASRLLKPLLTDELLNALLDTLGENAAEDKGKTVQRKPSGLVGRSLNILLAEDNPINQTLALRMLEKLGHHVHVVGNGQAAIDAYRERKYDAILMDVQMPVMGGFEATSAIRALEKNGGKPVPIIAMTAHAMAGDRERCLAAGMDDYVSKPIQSTMLDAALANVIGQTDVSPPETGADAMNSSAVPFDRNALIDSLGGDLELYGEIVRLFISHYPSELESLQRDLAAGDAQRLHRTAHSLKGAISNFAAPRATAAARTLEMALKGGMADNAAELVAETVAAVRELGEAMQADLEERV